MDERDSSADTAHTEIFASVTRPLFRFFGWGLGTRLARYSGGYGKLGGSLGAGLFIQYTT